MYELDGISFPCPDCGEPIKVEYDTAKCENCGWMAADAELDEILEARL